MELCDKYLHEHVELFPPSNDTLYYDNFNNKKYSFPNYYSTQFIKSSNDIDNKYYEILKKKDKNFNDQILFYDLKYDNIFKIFNDDYLLDINNNILFYYFEKCIDEHTKIDVIMNRLPKMNSITTSILNLLNKGLKNKIYINYLIINNFIYKSNEIFSNDLKTIKSNKLKTHINKYLITNIKKIYNFIINNYIKFSNKNIGLFTYKNGLKYYENLCKYNTLSTMTPDIIHNFGLQFLKEDLKLKKKLANKLKVKDIDDHVYKNNKYYECKNDILNDLNKQKNNLYKKLNKYFYDDINNLYNIKSISKINSDHVAYYISPDKKNKGAFYMNLLNPSKISKYELLVLSIHEGIPGHHYENELLFNSDKPDYIKNKIYSGYSEGWAFYCESLYEYDNDFEYYYSLQYRLERSLRLILDTGIHYFKWDFDKCFNYMKKYFKYDSDDFIKNQILRYSSNPGQALTYKIGEQVILHLKKDFLKKNNDIKAFHKIILDIGPCPLDLLVKQFYKNIL